MTAMGRFILTQIVKQVQVSAEAGQAKYRAYFVNTALYAAYCPEVDESLRVAGLGEVVE